MLAKLRKMNRWNNSTWALAACAIIATDGDVLESVPEHPDAIGRYSDGVSRRAAHRRPRWLLRARRSALRRASAGPLASDTRRVVAWRHGHSGRVRASAGARQGAQADP